MIAIIGAGISGLSLAHSLVKRGQQVTILEAGQVASGASGMATSYLERRLGNNAIRTLEQAAHDQWPILISEIERDSGRALSFNRSGLIKVAKGMPNNAWLDDLNGRRQQDWLFETLTQERLKVLEPSLSDDIDQAFLDPSVYWLDGAELCAALCACIQSAGADLIDNWRVTKLQSAGDTVLIHRDTGETLEAEKIVLCNAMGRNDIAGVAPDISLSQPIRGVTLVLDQSGLSLPLTHMIKHSHGHLCPQAGNRLIVGTTYEKTVDHLQVAPKIVELLYERAEPYLPEIRQLPLLAVNAGIRARSPDGLLKIGRSAVDPQHYFSLGHGGSGYLRAPAVMESLATFIVSGNKTGAAGPFLLG